VRRTPDPQVVTAHIATLCGVPRRLDEALADALRGRRPQGAVSAVSNRPPDRADPRLLVALDEQPPGSRFRVLVDAFELGRLDLDLFLLGLAPELDARYGDAFARLQDDRGRRRPSVGLAFDLLRLTPAQRLIARHLLGPESVLLRSGLLRLADPPGAPCSPLPDRVLAVDQRLAGFVTGDDTADEALAGIVDVVPLLDRGAGPIAAAGGAHDSLAALLGRPQRLCHLQGPEGAGRQTAAETLARAWGIPVLLRVRTARLPLEDPAGQARIIALVGREALLRGAAPYWDGFDVLLDEERAPLRARVVAGLAHLPHAFVASIADWPPTDRPAAAHVALAPPDACAREALWRRALGEPVADGLGSDLSALAAAFRLGPAAITAAAAEARTTSVPTAAGLAVAARRNGATALAGEAQRVPPHFGWDDLVLPPDRLQRLRSLGDRVRHRGLVHDEWGFAATLGAARGIAALFTGPSGTGKTMAAGVLAASLGLDLYRIDLAGLVSKYIGETEKNLACVFSAAAAADVVLFFDEADALFGKRTEVRDAHDRYANVEVAYLLQRIESHDGVVVLATNLRKNLDEAFLRRLQFVVEFPLPERADRRRIWERVFPAAAPLDPALDLDLLAERFELSGGSIRNVAVEAAFVAAAQGCAIGPDQVRSALVHEHQKLGRVAADRVWTSPGADGRAPLVSAPVVTRPLVNGHV
jgi:MoxR-like ATPase